MYRYAVIGNGASLGFDNRIVYFEGLDVDSSPMLSLFVRNAYVFQARRDAVFIANALNAIYGTDEYDIRLFKLDEVDYD